MNLVCGGAPCLVTLKKKRFQLLSSQNNVGVRAVRVDRKEQGQLLWGASSSLSIAKTSSGAPGMQLPRKESSGLHGAGFLLFLF